MRKAIHLILALCLLVSCESNYEPVQPEIIVDPVQTLLDDLKKEYTNVYRVDRQSLETYVYPSETDGLAQIAVIKDDKLIILSYRPTYEDSEQQNITDLTLVSKFDTGIEIPHEKYIGYGETVTLKNVRVLYFHTFNKRTSFIVNYWYSNNERIEKFVIINDGKITSETILPRSSYEDFNLDEHSIVYYYKDYVYLRTLVKGYNDFYIIECYTPSGEMVYKFKMTRRLLERHFDTFNSYIYETVNTGTLYLIKSTVDEITETNHIEPVWSLAIKKLKGSEKIEVKYLEFDGDIWKLQLDSIFWDGTKEQKTVKVDVIKGEIVK